MPSALRHFLKSEAAGGLLLMLAAALAMFLANSGFAGLYHDLPHARAGPELASRLGPMTVHLWINAAAMAVFFLLAGLGREHACLTAGCSARQGENG